MRHSAIQILASYVDALHPIIYINHFDYKVIDEAIACVSEDAHCIEFNNTLGIVNFKTKAQEFECDLEHFLVLNMDEGYNQETFLILKDVHEQLRDPRIISLLRRIAEDNLYREDYNTTIFIVSPVVVIPQELENYITIYDLPLPDSKEIENQILNFANDVSIQIDASVVNNLTLSLKGLNEFQIGQILNLAYQDGGSIDKDDTRLILREKEQFIKKAGLLELINFKEDINDIGGLENLKKWLNRKAKIFANLDEAIKFGVDIPKGILIVGLPGCGKSLSAKATAGLFKLPLVRLDVGRLMGKYVGESEANMRNALKLASAISPCVLWVDEIEKAFAGVNSNGDGNGVTSRLLGQFLTWMQEKDSAVFIVATANDISNLPLEFLRKGRFDELFKVDLPNGEERRKILEIHLKNRNKWNNELDTIKLIGETKGCSGADLEAIVKDAIEEAFIQGKKNITTDSLIESRKKITPIEKALEQKIKRMREKLKELDVQDASQNDPNDNI